ncbi:MAG TPA: dienelactone hydrolase family protein [Solirubrobacteraceae bacterium]
MFEQEMKIATADGEMTTFVAHPDGDGPFPIAVLYMDGVGYRDQIKENARRFAADGYYCVAPDLFYRSGEGLTFDFSRMSDEAYRARLMSVIGSVKPDAVVADTEAVFEAVAGDPAAADGPKVCVGYCMGARMALHAAAAMPDEFAAAAGIHPGALVTDQPDSPHRDLADVHGELYFAFAENDHSATPENVAEFRQALADQGVAGVVERLEGTSHGFAMADLPVYDKAATDRHFERTLDLWRRNLSQERVGT